MATPDTEAYVVQYRFTFETAQGTFSDAVNYTQAEFAAGTVAQRRVTATARRDAWLAQAVPSAAPVTKKVLRAARIQLAQQVAAQLQALSATDTSIDDPNVPEG